MGTTEGTTITLQSAVTRYANLKSIPLVIKNTSTGNITVNVAVEGQTIEGSASVILTTLQSLSFVSDGFNYWLF